ncbi:peptidase family M13 [Pleomassaria siparia CBS 279.74]|uniref:Peptidase family M13 n=1 Tax=Pleomassaria siparia CBS 279.74 TaxID=1314801 RepID=A0A6G1KF34_9PLEO|nr:peptidase family M13 [Pleomassaria siparia CBS 279.74]
MVYYRASSTMINRKLLFACAALFGSAIASPTRGFQSSRSPSIPRQDQGVCTTDVCKSYAEYLLSSRATNYADIDPCTDFGTYTCGNWGAAHPLGGGSSVSVFSVVDDANTALLTSILESPYPANTLNSTYADAAALDEQNFVKMVAAYDTCMDVDTINAAGAKPLQDVLDSYPDSGNLTDKMSWALSYGGKFSGAARAIRAYGFLQVFPWADDANPDVTTVAIGPGLFGLRVAAYYDDAAAVANYTNAIVGMFDQLFPEEEHDTHVSRAGDIVTLERALSSIAPTTLDTSDPSYYYNPMPIAQADALLPEISLSRLIKALAPSSYTIGTVVVFSPDYLSQLSSIVQNTTSEAYDAYLQWITIMTFVTRLSDDVSAPYRRFQNELSGLDPDTVSSRSATCISEVNTNLPWIETAFFVREAFNPDAKTLGEQIIGDIMTLFEEKLANYTWMSATVKTEAIQKVKNMIVKIGYPDISPNVEDPKAVADFYAPLNVTKSYFQNGLAFTNFTLTRTWNNVLNPTDKNYWVMTGPEVNADYMATTNDITFPAGIMQSPFFTLDLPDWANYGAFGAVIGHEVTHAFDNLGSQYDETGAYRQWWDNATLAAFEEKAQCFVSEFANYTITAPNGTALHVDGELTLSENIADTGGLSASYTVWQARNAEKPDQLLPGLEEYTAAQLFYLAFGNAWCGSSTPEYALYLLQLDPHSPSNVRIHGTVSNQVGFKEAFNCPSKEPTCELW